MVAPTSRIQRRTVPTEPDTIATLCKGLRLGPGISTISKRAVLVLHALKEEIMHDTLELNRSASFEAEVVSKAVDPAPGVLERLTLAIRLVDRTNSEPIALKHEMADALGLGRISGLLDEEGETLFKVTRFNRVAVTGLRMSGDCLTIGLTIDVEQSAALRNTQVE